MVIVQQVARRRHLPRATRAPVGRQVVAARAWPSLFWTWANGCRILCSVWISSNVARLATPHSSFCLSISRILCSVWTSSTTLACPDTPNSWVDVEAIAAPTVTSNLLPPVRSVPALRCTLPHCPQCRLRSRPPWSHLHGSRPRRLRTWSGLRLGLEEALENILGFRV